MEIVFLTVIFSIQIFIFKHIHTHVCLLIEHAFCLPLIMFHIIQPYPGGMGNYFIKITRKKLPIMLRGNNKITQPPCFGSSALKKILFRKAAAKAINICSVQKLVLNGEIQKPMNITVPARGSGSAVCLFLSKWLEDMERGLEGPLEPWREAWKGLQSPHAHLLL